MQRKLLRGKAAQFAVAIVTFLIVSAHRTFAQTDEIQVYDAEIAAPGVFNLMVHNNYTLDGLTTPRFQGGLVPNHTLNGVPEWAYGVTDWLEQGLYLPLYSDSSNLGPTLDGFKVRAQQAGFVRRNRRGTTGAGDRTSGCAVRETTSLSRAAGIDTR